MEETALIKKTDRTEKMKKLVPVLVPWFASNGRSLPWREDSTPYHVWISEIMLQQTRIETVKTYYTRFLKEIPDIEALASAPSEQLMKLWEGLGYYSRARNLQTAAQQIMTQFGGAFPQDYETIRSLRGIGDYTAGAIASICFNIPVPAVDGNVLRVISRITGDSRPITDEKTKTAVRMELFEIYPRENPGEFTQALMELGETICLPNGAPDCRICPCCEFCFSRAGEWKNLPVKAGKKERRKEQMTVFLLRNGDSTAVRKRGETGLLSGLWEFPNVSGNLSEEEAERIVKKWGCFPQSITEKGMYTHVFTHVEWNMSCYSVECGKKPEDFVWAGREELQYQISLPTAFRKLLK